MTLRKAKTLVHLFALKGLGFRPHYTRGRGVPSLQGIPYTLHPTPRSEATINGSTGKAALLNFYLISKKNDT
jgi:hypothetical protein